MKTELLRSSQKQPARESRYIYGEKTFDRLHEGEGERRGRKQMCTKRREKIKREGGGERGRSAEGRKGERVRGRRARRQRVRRGERERVEETREG